MKAYFFTFLILLTLITSVAAQSKIGIINNSGNVVMLNVKQEMEVTGSAFDSVRINWDGCCKYYVKDGNKFSFVLYSDPFPNLVDSCKISLLNKKKVIKEQTFQVASTSRFTQLSFEILDKLGQSNEDFSKSFLLAEDSADTLKLNIYTPERLFYKYYPLDTNVVITNATLFIHQNKKVLYQKN